MRPGAQGIRRNATVVATAWLPIIAQGPWPPHASAMPAPEGERLPQQEPQGQQAEAPVAQQQPRNRARVGRDRHERSQGQHQPHRLGRARARGEQRRRGSHARAGRRPDQHGGGGGAAPMPARQSLQLDEGVREEHRTEHVDAQERRDGDGADAGVMRPDHPADGQHGQEGEDGRCDALGQHPARRAGAWKSERQRVGEYAPQPLSGHRKEGSSQPGLWRVMLFARLERLRSSKHMEKCPRPLPKACSSLDSPTIHPQGGTISCSALARRARASSPQPSPRGSAVWPSTQPSQRRTQGSSGMKSGRTPSSTPIRPSRPKRSKRSSPAAIGPKPSAMAAASAGSGSTRRAAITARQRRRAAPRRLGPLAAGEAQPALPQRLGRVDLGQHRPAGASKACSPPSKGQSASAPAPSAGTSQSRQAASPPCRTGWRRASRTAARPPGVPPSRGRTSATGPRPDNPERRGMRRPRHPLHAAGRVEGPVGRHRLQLRAHREEVRPRRQAAQEGREVRLGPLPRIVRGRPSGRSRPSATGAPVASNRGSSAATSPTGAGASACQAHPRRAAVIQRLRGSSSNPHGQRSSSGPEAAAVRGWGATRRRAQVGGEGGGGVLRQRGQVVPLGHGGAHRDRPAGRLRHPHIKDATRWPSTPSTNWRG